MEPSSLAKFKKSFEKFARYFFKEEIVADACFCLHEKYQLNINVLLFCCWLPTEGFGRLTKNMMRSLLDRVTPWQEKVVQPLFHLDETIVSHYKQAGFDKIHNQVKRGLAEADHAERSLLLEMLPQIELQMEKDAGRVNYALGNIFTYLDCLAVNVHKTDLEKIYRITS